MSRGAAVRPWRIALGLGLVISQACRVTTQLGTMLETDQPSIVASERPAACLEFVDTGNEFVVAPSAVSYISPGVFFEQAVRMELNRYFEIVKEGNLCPSSAIHLEARLTGAEFRHMLNSFLIPGGMIEASATTAFRVQNPGREADVMESRSDMLKMGYIGFGGSALMVVVAREAIIDAVRKNAAGLACQHVKMNCTEEMKHPIARPRTIGYLEARSKYLEIEKSGKGPTREDRIGPWILRGGCANAPP